MSFASLCKWKKSIGIKSKRLEVVVNVMLLLIVLLVGVIGYNKYMTNKENNMYKSLGKMVKVNSKCMSVYVEGSGDKILVFMSGSGTCSPILDFMTLARELNNDYKVVIVEKFGYGFSDTTNTKRSLEVILEEYRLALKAAGVEGPYVLLPHSMSGIEALYWAEKHPEEIEGIIGLDMAVKETYADFEPNTAFLGMGTFVARTGILRFIPGAAESDAIKYGNLTDKEQDMYRAIFYQKTQTSNMVNEIKRIKNNANSLGSYEELNTPVLLFSSNGKGTGFEPDFWKKCQKDFINKVPNGQMIELKCSHYIHDIEYKKIAEEINIFLDKQCVSDE